MTDFLARLASRALGTAPSVQPVIGSRFEPGAALTRGLVTGVVDGDVVAAAHQACLRLAAQPVGAFAAIKSGLKGPAMDRARATLGPLRRAFVDAWYAPAARRRIGEARARLGGG